ncbi:MAG TPA: GDP-mannose 4,6-dehydratase [Nitrososphaeraceae archaeon]|nr:GDP-mannose 4,6-dehydratase [Nitrososphaeraceae archaeon]
MSYKERGISSLLITGAAGFVGSHLVQTLNKIGIKLKILDPFRSKTNSIWIERNFSNLKGIEIIKGSILDRNLLNRSLQEIDSVIHLASKSDIPYSIKDPFTVFETNCAGTMTLLEQCRLFKTIKCIILISSAHVYSMPPKYLPIDENHPLNTSTPYGVSKIFQDLMFQTYYKNFQSPIVVLRSGLLFGERQQTGGITNFIKDALEHKPITVQGGKQTRDICHVANLVNAILLSISNKDAIGQVFNISGEYERSIECIVKEIIEFTQSKSPIYHSPYRVDETAATRVLLDISKANNVLGYEPIVSFKEGLERTANWLKDQIDRSKAII